MKKLILSAAMLLGLSGMGMAQKYYDKVKIQTSNDSLSYAVGVVLASNVADTELENLNIDAVAKAFKDVLTNGNMVMDKEDASLKLEAAFEKIEEAKTAEARKKEKEFLDNNAKEPGVKVTESGLQYLVIKEGNGKKPTTDNRVKIHYEGKLTNGDVFDSSYDSDEPTTLDVDGVIDGMSEGLQLMSEGAEYIFYIPFELGYGSYSPGDFLPAYSTLVYTVELISVEEKPAEDEEMDGMLFDDDEE